MYMIHIYCINSKTQFVQHNMLQNPRVHEFLWISTDHCKV